MSALNFIFCSSIFSCLPILIALDIDGESVFCQILGCITVASGYGATCAQSLLSFNRYMSLYHPQISKRIFTRTKIWLMFFGVCLSAIFVCIHLIYFGFIGRMNGTICGPKFEILPIGHLIIYQTPLISSYAICIFFTYKVFRLIRNHQLETANLQSKLQDAKDIVRVIIIEITVPLSLSSPIIIMCFLLKTVEIHEDLFSFSLFLFLTHSATDPFIIVLVMKPYREHVLHLWRKFRGQPDTITPVKIVQVRAVTAVD